MKFESVKPSDGIFSGFCQFFKDFMGMIPAVVTDNNQRGINERGGLVSKKICMILGVFFSAMLLLTGCSGLTKANTKLEQKKYDEAIWLYQEYLQQHPESEEARRNMGVAYLKAGQTDKAVAEFRSILEKKVKDPYSSLYLGLAYLYKGEAGEAVTFMERFKNPRQPLVEEEVRNQIRLLQTDLSEKNLSDEDLIAIAERIEKAVELAVARQKNADREALDTTTGDDNGGGGNGGDGGCGC